jgi:Zn-dependent protease with chaperone function
MMQWYAPTVPRIHRWCRGRYTTYRGYTPVTAWRRTTVPVRISTDVGYRRRPHRLGTHPFSTTSRPTPQRTHWQRLAILIRYTRIPILVTSVYALGYQQGVMDCTKSPEAMQEQILQSILLSVGVKDSGQVQILAERDVSVYSVSRVHQVAAVGHKIICAAREYVAEQLQNAMDEVRAKLPPDVSKDDAATPYEKDATVQFWLDARVRLEGEKVRSRPWQYVFIQSKLPNAFVTEILPQRIFITTAMLELTTNADELALILGHEVSHLIYGHVSQANQVETMLRTLEVLLLTVDPTSGVLALGVIGLLAGLRKAAAAAFSREHEQEADDLGLIIAARACFDTVKGAEVMHAMHQHSISAGTELVRDSNLVRLYDTHPPSLERYRLLKEKSVDENYTKYLDRQCATVSSRLREALWGSPSPKPPKNGTVVEKK